MFLRRRLAMVIVAAALATPLAAQAPAIAPSGRGTSTVSEQLPEGSTATPRTITLDWGQPHLRGRALHTDSLVPYGAVWRTGANATTTLRTDYALMLGGSHLSAGAYALFTLPGADGWQLIVQREAGQTIQDYDAAKDLVRLPLRKRTSAEPMESLTMWLIPERGGNRGQLRMAWGTTELSIDWSVM